MKLDILRSVQEMTEALDKILEVVNGLPSDVTTASIVPQFGGQLRFWKPSKAEMAKLFGSGGWKRQECAYHSEWDYTKVLPCGITVIAEKMEAREVPSFQMDVDPALFEEPK